MGCRVAKTSSTVHPEVPKTPSVNKDLFHNGIVINACEEDRLFAKEIQVELAGRGQTAWCHDELDKTTGTAIVNALGLIVVLSEDTVRCPVCTDSVALAYVSNKPIVPVCRHDYNSVLGTLAFGMKLSVEGMKWVMFSVEGNNEQAFIELNHRLDELQLMTEDNANLTLPGTVSLPHFDSSVNLYEPIRKKQQMPSWMRASISSACSNGLVTPDADKVLANSDDNFWERHFGSCKAIAWIEFQAKFLADYESRACRVFGHSRIDWMMDRLHSGIFRKSETIRKEDFLLFQQKPGKRHQFWHQVKEYMLESHLMREVFDMESTVRLAAVQNLARFGSSTVASALVQLLHDQDANIRAVAALSLSHCGYKSDQIEEALIVSLSDVDRIVRESCCISLGNMGCTAAIKKLADVWYEHTLLHQSWCFRLLMTFFRRNEVIMNVRVAAEAALKQIGGDEVKRIIHVTRVLSDEISMLKEDLQMQPDRYNSI